MDIQKKIQSLNLPKDSFVVVGSGILDALKIRESNDIDMIVSQKVFDELDAAGWKHDTWADQTVLKKDLFDLGVHWMGEEVEQLLGRATVINDIPYLSLTDLLAWKKDCARPKDIVDVQLISEYQAQQII
jgi:hypothetical protein